MFTTEADISQSGGANIDSGCSPRYTSTANSSWMTEQLRESCGPFLLYATNILTIFFGECMKPKRGHL